MGKQKIQVLSNISLILVAIIWGSGFVASQMELDANLSSAFIMFVRFAIATIIIGVVFYKDLKANMKKEHLKGGIVIGLFLFLAFYVQTVGLQYTTPSNNAFITASNVVMVPFLWWIISKKRPSLKIFISSFLCLLGIGILSFNFSTGISFKLGDLLTLLCALLFACQIITTGVLAQKMDAKVVVFLQFAVATVLGFITFMLTDRNFGAFGSASGMAAVAYLGIFSTCLCYFLQTTAQQHVESAKAAIILATESLFGTVFSVILGYDKLTVNMVLGGLIILISILMTELKLPKKGEKELPEAELLFEEKEK